MPRTLINMISEENGYPFLTTENYDDFVNNEEVSLVYFAGDPKRYPEALDVIVVLPELEKAFKDQFKIAVVDESAERELSKKYGFTMWPAMVFLKNGKYVDLITRIRDWSDYMEEIPVILAKEATRAPSIGIAVEAK